MAVADERELKARVDAADTNARKCSNGHAICGNNVYRDGWGHRKCWLCKIERNRAAKRQPAPSRRRPHVPLNPAIVTELRRAAGVTVVDITSRTQRTNATAQNVGTSHVNGNDSPTTTSDTKVS